MPPAVIMFRVAIFFFFISIALVLVWAVLKYLFGIEMGFVWRLLGIKREQKEKKFEKLLEKEKVKK